MAVLGNMVVNILGNSQSLTTELKTSERNVESFSSRVTTGFAKAGLAIQGVASVVGLVANVLSTPLSLAADLEQTQVAFKVMLGSAEQADTLLRSLQEFSASTPFEMPGIRKAATSLLAFGVESGNIVPSLKALGDVASGTNQPLEELAELYGKAKVQGRLFMEDINQLTGRGIPIIQELAKQFGVTDDKVRKLVESGKINFSHLEKSFQNLTSEGGKFSGMMGEQSRTLAGKWSTLKDTVGLQLAALGTEIAETFDLNGLMDKTGGFIEQFSAGIRSFWAEAQPLITAFGNLFGNVLDANIAAWNAYGEAAGTLWESFGGGKITLSSVVDGLTGVIDAVADFYETSAWAFQNWDTLLLIGAEHVKLFASNSWERIKTFATNVGELYDWLGENWFSVLQTMSNAQIAVFDNMGKNIRMAWKEIIDYIKSGGTDAISFDWTPLLDGFVSTISKLPEFTAANIRETTPELERLYGELTERAKSIQQEVEAVTSPTSSTAATAMASQTGDTFNNKPVAALERNSAEAFSAIQKAIRGGSKKEEKAQEAAVKTEQHAKETSTTLKAMKDIIKSNTLGVIEI